ncbi:hypothetical protein [Bradyrhizobium sp. RDM4]|uniref:hypothetical protein n=1 Tax=Bradyrhizobium sp. RDM4 TaxID=3378765 RepID=UPI0038FD36AE
MLSRPEPKWWSVPPAWQGETAFLVGGGPSVAGQDLARLRGRRVIAINSSYALLPFADILFFGDLRWWNDHKDRLDGFAGRIVTCRKNPGGLKGLRREVFELERQNPPGLALHRSRVIFRRTSYAAAINLAVHLGCAEIVALGLDGKRDAKGRAHHHAPHRWPTKPACWAEQLAELATLVEPLQQLGVRVRNASPGSAVELWPHVDLEDILR